MNYAQEFQSTFNELVDELNPLLATLIQADANKTDETRLAEHGFQSAIMKAQAFVHFGKNDFSTAMLIKSKLAAKGDIFADALREQIAALGL